MCKTGQTDYRVRCIAGLEVSMLREESNSDTSSAPVNSATTILTRQRCPPKVKRGPAPPGRNPEQSQTNPFWKSDALAWKSDALPPKSEALVVRERMALNELFVTRTWHRSYAEALLETDGAKLPALIAGSGRSDSGAVRRISGLPGSDGRDCRLTTRGGGALATQRTHRGGRNRAAGYLLRSPSTLEWTTMAFVTRLANRDAARPCGSAVV